MRSLIPLLSFVLLVFPLGPVQAQGEADAIRVIQPGSADGLPFSGGVLAGPLLHLAGALGNKPGTLELQEGAKAQTEQAIANLDAVLEDAGMNRSHVISTTVFVSDARFYPQVGPVVAAAYSDAAEIKIAPARSSVQADIALPGAIVEIAAVAARPGVEVKELRPEGWPVPSTGYSWAVEAGGHVFVSAQAGTDFASGKQGANVREETKLALANIHSVLASGGLDLESLVSCRVYLSDAREFGAMNEGWREAFGDKVPPTRATIRATGIQARFRVMLQCNAMRGEKKVVTLNPDGNTPFSPALQVGDTLVLSGFVGRGPNGYSHDVGEQTGVVLDRLAAHLEKAGMTFADVVSSEVWVDDIRHYDVMNLVYRKHLPVPPPARATVASRLMSPDAKVEIAMIAVRGKKAED